MESEMIQTALARYNVTDAAIAQLKQEFMPLVVKALDDKEGYKQVHEAKMVMVKKRTDVEKTRKELKEDALRYGQAVDKEAKRITGLMAPIEEHLKAEEDKIENEKARIKAEAEAKEAARIQVRVDRICDFGAIFNGQMYTVYGLQIPVAIVKVCTDEQFDQLVAQVQGKKAEDDKRIKAEDDARKAESARLAKVAADQEEERQRIETIKKEQEEAAIKMVTERLAIQAAQMKIEREKKEEEDGKKRAAELEKAKIEAAERAEKETESRIKREAEEKVEKERLAKIAEEKKAARRPDKEKAITYLNATIKYMQEISPSVKDQVIHNIISEAEATIENAVDESIKKIEVL